MSEDDNTFNNGVKSSLIKLMGSQKTVTNFTGGHLAMIFKAEQYVQIIREFIENN